MVADTPRGLQSFQPAPKSEKTGPRSFAPTDKALESTPPTKVERNLEIRRNIYDQSGKDLAAGTEKQANGEDVGANGAATNETGIDKIEDIVGEPKKTVNCYSCGIDCTRVRFHYAKTAPSTSAVAPVKVKYDLCPSCFQCARFPEGHDNLEFVKLEDSDQSGIPDRDAPWTDTELLLLLEGLELFDENWNYIADHVKTRTREECVVKFLQLEIEDKYLEGEANTNPSFGALDRGRIPFTQADNPVMSVIAFLASMSDPSVAAAAAGRSVDEMRRTVRNRLENGMGGAPESQSQPKQKVSMKSEDSMDIDTTVESPRQANATNNQVSTSSGSQANGTTSLPAIAFAASAARAAALVSNEEREMTRLVSSAVNTTLEKFELKLKQFSEMEAVLQAERRELERGRQQLFLDRLAFRKRVQEAQEALKLANLTGGEEGAQVVQDLGSAGAGEKLGFQAVVDTSKGVFQQPLSAGDGNYRSIEI